MKSALGEETKLVPPLEDILQRKLDQSRSHGGACDPAEVRLRYVGIYRIRELGVVEEIEELRPELERCVFPDSPHAGGFDGEASKLNWPGPRRMPTPELPKPVPSPMTGTEPNAAALIKPGPPLSQPSRPYTPPDVGTLA